MTDETSNSIKLICGDAHPELGNRLAAELGLPLTSVEITSFADGETRIHIEDELLAATVCILQPTCTPVNENLLKLAPTGRRGAGRRCGTDHWIGTLFRIRAAGPARTNRRTALRRKSPPSCSAAWALIIWLYSIFIHRRSQRAFPFSTTLLTAEDLFWERIKSWRLKQPVVISPDAGGIKCAASDLHRN